MLKQNLATMNIEAFGNNEVALIADELSRAVEITLNPTVAHDARKQAYTACERYIKVLLIILGFLNQISQSVICKLKYLL